MRELWPQRYAIGFGVQLCVFEVRYFSVVCFSRLVVDASKCRFKLSEVGYE
jgi:hypothetical protein